MLEELAITKKNSIHAALSYKQDSDTNSVSDMPSNLASATKNADEMRKVFYGMGNNKALIIDESDLRRYKGSIDFITLTSFNFSELTKKLAVDEMNRQYAAIERRYAHQLLIDLYFNLAYPNGIYSVH